MSSRPARRFAPPATPCRYCAVKHDCDGSEAQGEFFGCYSHHAASGVCQERGWTCPCNPEYLDRWRQAKTRPGVDRAFCALRGVGDSLPQYIPAVHGRRYRAHPFLTRIAAVPLSQAVRTVGSTYSPVASTPASLREHFGLCRDAAVLVLGVGKDPIIERYWQHRNAARIPEALAALGLSGMTCPNYSFFPDVPRTHTLWNRARMHLNLEELSAAGVSVVPHLNATTETDWRFWAALLKAAPSVFVVAKEFQTGNKRWDVGVAAILRMRRLQDELGRRLHPLLIGGAQFAGEAASSSTLSAWSTLRRT